MHRFAPFLLVPALFGCALERAFLLMSIQIVAAPALVLIAWGAVQTYRKKFGQKQRVTIGILSTAAIGAGCYFLVVEALAVGFPLPTKLHVWLIASVLLWVIAIAIAGFGTRGWTASLVIGGSYVVLALGTCIWLWRARVPDAAIEEVVVSEPATCVRYAEGSVVCRGSRGNGVPTRWPVPVEIPAANAMYAGPCQTCATTESGEVWCWGATEASRVGQWNAIETVIPLPAGLLIRAQNQWTWETPFEIDWWAEACGDDDDDLSDTLERLNGADDVAASNDRVCIAESGVISCRPLYRGTWRTIEELPPAERVFVGSRRLVCGLQQQTLSCNSWDSDVELAAVPDRVVIGSHHVCTEHGTRVVCVGRGWGGVLGHGTDGEWRRVEHDFATLRGLSARGQLTCALHGDGVSCWGTPNGFRLQGEGRFIARGPLRDALSPRYAWDEPAPFR